MNHMEKKDKECFHETTFLDENENPITLKIPVVQELARQGLKHLPQRFNIKPPHPPPCGAHEIIIPTISLAKLKDGSEPTVQAEERGRLGGAARGLGAFVIVEHGIPWEVVEVARDVVRGFFELSFEEKKKCVGTYGGYDNMGYGRNYIKSEDQAVEWIDRLTMRAVPPVGDDEGLLVWPRKPNNFREAMERYVEEARGVMDFLLVALAESLSLENHNAFHKYFHPKHSELKVRINYYPPCPTPDQALGLNPHSDPSALSILTQFGSNQGLQVLNNDKKWVTVSWPQDHLLVIIGDLLEMMSNGLVQSTWHRAVTQRDVERGSIALFYCPPPKTLIEPIVTKEDDEEAYKKVVVQDYVGHYYKVSPTLDKIAINFAKVN